MPRFRAFDGSRAPKERLGLNPEHARGLKFWTDFRERGGNTIVNQVCKKRIATRANMENADWGVNNFGRYLDFDGVDEHAQYAANFTDIIPSVTQPFTVLVWCQPDGWPTTRDGIISCDNGSGTQGFDIRLENSGANPANGMVFRVGNFGSVGGNAAVFPAANMNVTSRQLFGGVFTGTATKAYVNGVKGTDGTSTSGGGYAFPFYIGVNFNDAFADRNFNGKIFDVKIYDRAFTDAEMMARWHPATRFDFYRRERVRTIVPVPPTPATSYYLGGNAMNKMQRGIGWAA